MAWISVVNTLTVSAQLALPDWVRARGMSIYQMAIMGASALGAATWGQVAALSSVQSSLMIAAISGALTIATVCRHAVIRDSEEDLTPTREFPAPTAVMPLSKGRVLVTTEYRIDPARADEFLAMMAESRRSRLRQGVLDWNLLHDIAQPERYIVQILDESWTEHLRRFDRLTAADVVLRDRKLAFQVGGTSPTVTRYVIETTAV